MIYLSFGALVISFVLLFGCAGFFVKGASLIAAILNVPKMVVGIVLVGLATTAPEFTVTVVAAFKGYPELALGNAIGSVICDDGIALAFAAILAPTVIYINCRMLKVIGIFLLGIDFLAYFLARNGSLGRIEGLILLLFLGGYFVLILKHRYFKLNNNNGDSAVNQNSLNKKSLKKPILLFAVGITGVIITAEIIVKASIYIATYFDISEIIIGSTVVAIGTSLPEISTCITAALKGEGEIAVGNILGADVLNVLWIIGVASVVSPIHVEKDVINFTFPYMILMVTVMLVFMRFGCRLQKFKGFILFGLYLGYLCLTLLLFT